MENIRSLTALAENMRRLRKIKQLTQEELAYRTGLHPYSIGLIERKVKAPSLRSVEKIAKSLNVSVAELVSDSSANEKTMKDARGEEVAQLMRGLDAKKADAVLDIVKTVAKMVADAGRVKELKAAEEKPAYIVGRRKKKK